MIVGDPITLYYAARSSALPARLVLDLAEADYELAHVNLQGGEQNSAWFLDLNAHARVPVLRHGDFTLTENVAILTYLAAIFPINGMNCLDRQTQARCLEWLAWGASILHPALAHDRRPCRYARTPDGQSDVSATARATLPGLFRMTEARLSRSLWAAGEICTEADLYLLFFWLWGPRLSGGHISSNEYPRWTALANRLLALPTIASVLVDEGLL